MDSLDWETRNRLHRLEQKVDFLLQELNLVEKEEASLPRFDPDLTEVVALAQQNNKIGAIKRYREITGCDLQTAKQAVDNLSY